MGRFPQSKDARGSLKWTQVVVNECPELINRPLRENCMLSSDAQISWLSPVQSDDFAEYRDQAFLQLLGVQLEKRPLETFWPNRGPQWDALGRTHSGELFLVESKAHISEILSPGTSASAKSRILIEKSLKELQSFLRVSPVVDWSTVLYQYTNRMAHLYLLRELNHLRAFLVFLYFVGDCEMEGPCTVREWEVAIQVVRGVLGLRDRNRLSRYILDVFIDVADVKEATAKTVQRSD